MRTPIRWVLTCSLICLLSGTARSEVLDANSDGLVGPEEVLELVRLWKEAAVPHATASSSWSLGGNDGTLPGTHFLGTTDNQGLEIRVGNQRVLRFDPDPVSPRIVAGSPWNGGGGFGTTIGGGGSQMFPNQADGLFGTIAGGYGNFVTNTSTIGGGALNRVSDEYSTVAGGSLNEVTGTFGSIGGGGRNQIYTSIYATIGGGYFCEALGDYSTIGGGESNAAVANYSTIAGGSSNSAQGQDSTVGGGYFNSANAQASTVAGGSQNTARGRFSSVAGGQINTAVGMNSMVLGGIRNAATGEASLAAGNRAQAYHDGAFVWADNTGGFFPSTATNQFLVRADGGMGVGTNTPQTQLHVVQAVSGGASLANHVAAIENISSGNNQDVLALKMNLATPGGANDYITFMNDAGNIGSIEGNGLGGIALVSGGADFAEFFPLSVEAETTPLPGEIVGLVGNGISRKTRGAQRVFVVSSEPLVLGNRPPESDRAGHVPVALLGQVTVRVRGQVEVGDFVIPSGEEDVVGIGVPPGELGIQAAGQIVGWALSENAGAGSGTVRVVVGLPNDRPWREIVRQRELRLSELEEEVSFLKSEIAEIKASLQTKEGAIIP